MLPMINKYNIKTMYELQGKSLRAISEETGHSFRTVKKYATMEDFNVKLKPSGVSIDIGQSRLFKMLVGPVKHTTTYLRVFLT